MRWTLLAPLIVFAGCLLATLALLAPVIAASPWLAPSPEVRWMTADDDGRPRRATEGERTRTLARPGTVSTGPMRQYWFTFDRKDAPPAPMGVLALPTDPSARMFINGLAVLQEARAGHGEGALGAAPRDGLQAGANRIEVIIPPVAVDHWPRAIFLGPMEPLRAADRRLADIGYLTVRVAALLGSGAALIGFLLVFLRRERQTLAQPSLLALVLAGQAAIAWLGPASNALLPWTWLTLLLPAAAALLVLLIVGAEPALWARSTRNAFRLGAAGVAVLLAAAPLALWRPDLALVVSYWASGATVLVGAGTGLVLLAVSSAGRAGWPATLSALGIAVCLSLAAGVVAAIDWLGPWGLLLGQTFARVTVASALAGWFVWVGVQGFVDLEAGLRRWLGLGRIIREQQTRLERQQAVLEAEISRRAVLEERERLSRDIHDGVGGSLAVLLLQARNGRLEGQALASGLEQALDDLRLMIDALDHSPESLPAAFTALRMRLIPAFQAAGIALEWRHDGLDGLTLQRPRDLLQVFRILQEACTNIIRHSGAANARVAIIFDPRAAMMEIQIADDGAGSGADRDAIMGRGLKNMSERARRVGGTIVAGADGDGAGWRVTLCVPVAAPAPAVTAGPGR